VAKRVTCERAGKLRAIDPAQLQKAAERVREETLERKHRGSGGLLSLYPRTVGAWRQEHPEDSKLEELAALFLESRAFESYRERPFAGPGICLEEAFYRYCEEKEIGERAAREDEHHVPPAALQASLEHLAAIGLAHREAR